MAKKKSKATHDAIIFCKLFSYCQEKAERKRKKDGKIHPINMSLNKREIEAFIQKMRKERLKTTSKQIQKILKKISRPMVLSS